MSKLLKRDWLRLDNAALIFPATMNNKWSNVFRLSATLKEDINPEILQKAVYDLKTRFPSFYVSLHNGFFWSYLQKNDYTVIVKEDYAYPLTYMGKEELRENCLRVLYYKNRIAVEIFHSICDGTSGRIYLCTLVAHYLKLAKNIDCSTNQFVLNVNDEPTEEELTDCFRKYSNNFPASRKESNSFKLKGTRISYNYAILTTGIIDTEVLLAKAHQYNCTITCLLSALMIQSLIQLQLEKVAISRQKEVKVTIPVNLRKTFNDYTLRNFVLTVNVGVDPRKGEYSLSDICKEVSHQLAYLTTPQNMASRIASNVTPAVNKYIRLVPLFLKNCIMNLVYKDSGEKKGSLNISNLGNTILPDEIKDEVERIEFIVGVQKSYPNNCAVVSLNGKTYINMIRNIKESELERLFFTNLVKLDIPVKIETNWR